MNQQDSEASNNNNTSGNNSSTNIPEKYFIVKNNDYVRVKYLLIYSEKSKLKKLEENFHMIYRG